MAFLMTLLSLKRWIWVFLFALALSACQKNSPSSSPSGEWQERAQHIQNMKKEMVNLEKKLKETVSDNYCEISNHCDFMGVGPLLCGKRPKFLAYSIKRVDFEQLRKDVDRYNSLAEELNKQSYKALSCGVDAPAVRCVKNQCVLN